MILGAVIAGGRSTRFGSDKAQATIAGRAMLDVVAAVLRSQVDALVVCGRDWPGLTAIPDRPGPGLGPLGGINAALHHGAAAGFSAVLTVPCDTPDVDPGLLEQLAARPDAAILIGCPIIARWPTSLAAGLDAWLATTPDRSIRAWARHAGAAAIPGRIPSNVNRPEDLPTRAAAPPL